MGLELRCFLHRHLINSLDKMERLCSAVIELVRRNGVFFSNNKHKPSYSKTAPGLYFKFTHFFFPWIYSSPWLLINMNIFSFLDFIVSTCRIIIFFFMCMFNGAKISMGIFAWQLPFLKLLIITKHL